MTVIDTRSRLPDYADLDLDFITKPGTDDILKKVGDESIKRAIRNLILTNPFDRPFNPTFGSGIKQLLFENATEVTAILISKAVETTIATFEPRVDVLEVTSLLNEDNNSYTVTIVFTIKNRPEPIITSIFLERIR